MTRTSACAPNARFIRSARVVRVSPSWTVMVVVGPFIRARILSWSPVRMELTASSRMESAALSWPVGRPRRSSTRFSNSGLVAE